MPFFLEHTTTCANESSVSYQASRFCIRHRSLCPTLASFAHEKVTAVLPYVSEEYAVPVTQNTPCKICSFVCVAHQYPAGLGTTGAVVQVKRGFGRNYLLPEGCVCPPLHPTHLQRHVQPSLTCSASSITIRYRLAQHSPLRTATCSLAWQRGHG
jgi:hypothetical protein